MKLLTIIARLILGILLIPIVVVMAAFVDIDIQDEEDEQ